MTRTRRRWVLAILGGLTVGGLVAAALLIPSPIRNVIDPGANARREGRPRFGPDESRPIQHTHVGKSREELIAELGQPTKQGPWQIGMPRDEVSEKHKGLQTLEWHWESGQFWASVYPTNERWVCFDSIWVPKGTIIE